MSDITTGIVISVLALAVAFIYAQLQEAKDQEKVAREAARRLAVLAELRRKQLKEAYAKRIENTPDDGLAAELNRRLRQEDGDI